MYSSDDPESPAGRLLATLDSLSLVASPDSLSLWGTSATALALEAGVSLARMDSVTDILADADAEVDARPSTNSVGSTGCSPPAVLFVNGISTTWGDFVAGVTTLKTLLRRAGLPWSVVGQYNRSAKDVETSVWGGSVCSYTERIPLVGGDPVGWSCRNIIGSFIDLTEASSQEMQQWGGWAAFRNRDVTALQSKVLRELEGREGLVIVAHSQGNLMVNQAIEGLLASGRLASVDRLRILRLGSPIDAGPIEGARRIDVCGDLVSGLAGYGFSGCDPPPPTGWSAWNAFAPHLLSTSYFSGQVGMHVVDEVRTLGQSLVGREYFVTIDPEVVAFDASRLGIRVRGTLSCMTAPRRVKVTAYRHRLGPQDPARMIGEDSVRPSAPEFDVKLGPVLNCEDYLVVVEHDQDPEATLGVLVSVTEAGAGSEQDDVYFDPSVAPGPWRPFGNVHNTRGIEGSAGTGSSFGLGHATAEANNDLGLQRLWMPSRVDEQVRFQSSCREGEGSVVTFSGAGSQQVGIINDHGNYQEVRVDGTFRVEIWDGIGLGKDVVVMDFRPTAGLPNERFGIAGPFQQDFPLGTVRIVMGR